MEGKKILLKKEGGRAGGRKEGREEERKEGSKEEKAKKGRNVGKNTYKVSSKYVYESSGEYFRILLNVIKEDGKTEKLN